MKAEATDAFYNVGMGVKTTIKELTELILETMGSDLEIQYEPAGTTFVKNRVGCPIKSEKEIKFKAQIPLREGLQKLIEWRQSHKNEVLARRRAAGLVDE
jgi:UDP-glucose 4-epimerase